MPRRRSLSLPGWRTRAAAGTALLAASWWVTWHGTDHGRIGDLTFFPLWLGYIVALDAITERRTGSSLLRRSPGRWLGLFAASAPAWWVFEWFNGYLGNWRYVGTDWATVPRIAHATLCFSTVMPAVFTTADALDGVVPQRVGRSGPAMAGGGRLSVALVVAGLGLAAAVIGQPAWFFPAVWVCVLLILDPLNDLAGWPSLLSQARRGNWRTALLLAAAALLCGLWWELWNHHSSPKWVYLVSLAPFGLDGTIAERKVFEMPLLGFGGYLPFGLELFALHQTCAGLVGRTSRTHLRFDRAPEHLAAGPPGRGQRRR